MLRVDEVELHHELTAVADAERQRVLAGIELVEGFLRLRVVEEGTGPALGRTQHVAVGEATAEHYHVNLFERLTTADEVGHHHVLHLEAGEPQRISHLTVAVGTLFADDGGHRCLTLSLCGRILPTVGVEAQRGERALEVGIELHLERLLLIVVPTLARHVVHALMLVEEVRRVVPRVAQGVDVEGVLPTVLHHHDLTVVGRRIGNLCEADAIVLEVFLQLTLVGIGDLDDDTRVLGKEHLHNVGVILKS